MDNLYNDGVPIGQEERQQFLAQQPQQTPANQVGENQQFDEETTQYLETLSPEERQAAIDEINAPMNGEDIAEALKQNADFIPTQDEYLKYVAFNKTHESSIIDGIGEGVEMVLNDLGKAVGAVADHPLKALATAPTSLIEAFAQGTRNLYGMVAQSANPDSVLFGFKNALAGDGSPEGYNQFLEARRFNKHSARLASGEDTLVMDKNVIDHDITLAMSYIADPTLFIPFGTAATAGMKAVGMGEKLVALGGRAAQLRNSVIGGTLKWGIGAPIEFIGGTTRAVIDTAVATGGNVLETATGISAAELRATARMSAVGTTTASALGGHIPVVSSISNAYVAGSAAAGIGEAIGAVGEQMLKQGGQRGFNSFAREALRATPNLSKHAQGLLKVLDAVDPMFSYGYGIAGGAAHGAAIGGTLGYLSGGEEGLGHGIGAGLALGAVGAGAGRLFADISGGTEMARAEVQGGFVLENMRTTKHKNLAAAEAMILDATLKGDRGGALQVLAGLDRIAPDTRLVVGNYADQVTMLKSRGLDIDGHKVDPATGKKILDANGKPVEFAAGADAFKGGEGFVMYTDMDATGKRQVTIHINTDAKSKNVLHHELFHAVFAETVMKGMFRDKFAKAVLGEFDANGIRVKGSEVDPKEMRQFVRRELQFTRDSNGNRLSVAEVKKRLAEFDGHLAEYEKAGATTKMNPDSARALDKIVEEFGAHYATQFMKGKSLDYLFHGGELPGIRGMMDRVQNGFLDFWQSNITKQNPTFGDFTKSFDKSFAPDKGKRTLAQRSSAIDYAVQDLIRAAAGKNKGSSNSIDVRTMTPDSRKAFFESSGMDGTKYFFDKNGKPRAVTEAQVKMERLAVGKAIHDSLSALDPKVVAGLKDVDGNFVASSTLGTKFNDTMLAHLVKEGHISQLLADRIRAVQDIVSGKGSNVVSYLYHGESMETQVGPRSPRLYGADVPITARETVVVGYKISVKKDGSMSLTMKGLDKKIIDTRGNTLWAEQSVRDLWQGDRNAYDQSFYEYLSNASKASTDLTRQESSLLPSLARGDGFGNERRNVMHQWLGMAKRDSATYFNKPIAEIPRGKTSTVFNQSMDLMSPMRSDLPTRYDFNLDNAHSDLSRNFKVSDMDVEKTTQGNIFTHASGFKIIDAEGSSKLYNKDGEVLGSFKDKEAASVQMEKAYAAERVETEKRIERVKESQQKQQQNFKVFDDETFAKGRELGDIFETDAGKAFHAGTELIRQTREEFYSDNFIKLRQSDPETVLNATEGIMARVEKIAKMKEQMEDAFYASSEKGIKREIQRQELMNVTALLQRYNDIRLAYGRATKGGKRDGQAILDYINTHRRTSVGYDNMAKVFFGEQYDAQFQTGKPVTTVATHGTNSNELLTSKEFDTSKLGSRHMSDKDKVGVFLSGETKTSFGYADPMQGEQGYRQVRAAIKFNNPLVVDYGFNCFDGAKYERIFNTARTGGHDGVIIKNVYDGGSADTVFVVMADKIKDNTAIIDTHIGMDKVDTATRTLLDQDQGAIRYPIQQSMPRGKGVRVGSDLGLSFKSDDTTPTTRGTPSVLVENIGAELLRKGIASKKIELSDTYKGLDIGRLKGIAHTADTMAVGDLKISNKTVENLQGGMFFHMLHGDLADFWASTFAGEGESSVLVKWMNEAIKVNGRKFNKPESFITLVKPDNDKIFQSPTGTKSVLQILDHLVENGAMSPETLKQHLIDASTDKYVSGKKKGSDKQKISFDETESYRSLMEQALEELPTHSFENRKLFIESLFSKIAKSKEVSGNAYLKMREVIGGKSWNAKNTSKFTAAEANRVFGDLLAEPMIRDVPKGHAYAVIKIKSPIAERVDSGLHESYRSTVVQTSGQKPVMSIMTKTAPAWEIVNNAKNQRIQEYNKARKMSYVNELGGSQNPYAKVVAKSNESMPFKVDDLAGEPRDGGRTYEVGSQQWKTGFLGRIAEKDPAKIEGMELRYSENTRLIKGKNLVTLTLHNKEGQQIGILNADVYNDGTAKIVDTQVAEQFGNRGYSKLMLSEFGERVRSQGIKEVYGEIVDKLGRPDKARKSVFGNSELDLESYSNISTSGHATVSKLDRSARYMVSDEDGPVPNIDWDALLKAEEKTKDKRSNALMAQQRYTENEMSSSFIGRIAEENPRLTNGKNISYKGYGQSLKMLILEDSATGETIGSIQVQTRKSGQSAYISYSDVREAHQGRGYGTLLYSELAERLRHDGYTTLNGEIVDSLGRPLKIREKVIDQENKRIGEEGSAIWGDKVYSPLYTDAHYKVFDEKMGSAFIGRVAKENPKITKGIRVEFEKTRSSKFGDEYILRLFKKDKSDGGEEILIGTFNSEVDGNSASSGNAEIKGDFRNKGYGRLMYSEMAERLRALGAESWGGRMVDQKRRPQTLRERVIDQENARLGYQDSETKLSDERQDYNGDKTFYIESTLHKEAHYKVSDADVAQVQQKVDYLKGLMERFERFKDAKGRENSDNKRRYWDAKREYNSLNDYTLKPMLAERQKASQDIKPLEGKYKVNDSVKKGVDSLGKFIADNADTANISPAIKQGIRDLQEAIRKQDATDEVLVPELRASFDAIQRSIEDQLSNPSLTPVEILKQLQKTLKPLDNKIQKNSERIQKNARDAIEQDMAEGADIESEANAQRQGAYRESQNEGAELEADITQEGLATQRRDMAEGADLESKQAMESDLEVGADVEAASLPPRGVKYPQFPYPAPATPAFPKPPIAPARPVPAPASQALPSAYSRPFPKNVPEGKPLGKLEGWRGWTLEKGLNGGFWKNGVGWMIVVQADKFKVYNPQKAMQGIYEDLDQAKRRVQRAEPKQ
jgi:ribosomal protein S18 acetylase RimI-like enzyme